MKKLRVTVPVSLDVHDIVSEWRADDAYEFIVALDSAMADWDFTIRLADYFDAQRKLLEKEEADEAAKEAKRKHRRVSSARPTVGRS